MGDIGKWIKDFDSEDSTRFAVAKSRLRLAGVKAHGALLQHLPQSTRGKQAAIELLMLTPPDPESDSDRYAAMRQTLTNLLSNEVVDETSEDLALRLQALSALTVLDDPEDAPVVAGRMKDPRREIRWYAATYFRKHPGRLNKDMLADFVGLLKSPEEKVRMDAGRLLVDLHATLMSSPEYAPLAFSPVAPAAIRAEQILRWHEWVETAEGVLRSRALEDGGKHESGDDDTPPRKR